MPYLFKQRVSEVLYVDNLSIDEFWKPFMPDLVRRNTKDLFGMETDPDFHVKVVQLLRHTDVIYFLRIKELNNLFKNGERSFDTKDWRYIIGD